MSMPTYKRGDRVRVTIEAEVTADSEDDYLRLQSKSGGTLVIRSTDCDATIERVSTPKDGPKPTYAWCFSHGRLHTFWPSRIWCTADWIELAGATKEEALHDKRSRFGEAQFIHGLPSDQRLSVLGACAERRNEE